MPTLNYRGPVMDEKTIAWLLEENEPAVRYETLICLLGAQENDPKVLEEKRNIMRRGAVPKILEKMSTGEFVSAMNMFYTRKYSGLVWQLIILAELNADGGNEEIKRYCEYLISHSQEPESGGFSTKSGERTGTGLRSSVIPCLTGNMVWSLIRFGYLNDPRVQKAVNWLVKYQRYDDGEGEPSGWPYDSNEMCWGKHTCHMGAGKALKAFSDIPPDKRTPKVNASIDRGVEYLLKHHIFKKSHDLSKVSKPGWTKFSFPLMYQTDALEILHILTRLGVRDSRMNEALDLVESRRNRRGRWDNTAPLEDKFLMELEPKGESKWVTLRALEVLKAHGRE